MNIPKVIDLHNDAKKLYEKEKEKELKKLDEILNKRKETRKNWTNEEKEKFSSYLNKLSEAHNNFVNAVILEIIKRTKQVLKDDHSCKKFIILNPQNIECKLNNFTYKEIYQGFWNNKIRKYDRIKHIEAGINKNPLDEISDKMEPYGYDIYELYEDGKVKLEVNLKIET